MKLFILTPVYATTTEGSGATPVVHYFTKEWVKQGHEVYVYHLIAKYPRFYYWVSKLFKHSLNSRLGFLLPTEYPSDCKYNVDGVDVHQVTIFKFIPHSLFSKRNLNRAISEIREGCSNYGIPDVFIGHWHNPQLELLVELKKYYKKKTCLVLHNNSFDFLFKIYGQSIYELLAQIDVIGFRSIIARNNYISIFGEPKKSFVAYSGVSNIFLESGAEFSPNFENSIHKFVYVGSLIARKYPTQIVQALFSSYKNGDFTIKYIGDGAENKVIEELSVKLGIKDKILFTGRIPRESIIEYLKDSQCFVMISKYEIFGLVYLEAMAMGLIPIGSKNEGIDGIIINGVNGFLCEAGNSDELSRIFSLIQTLSKDELITISENAKKTAFQFSDSKVAESYLKNLL